MFERFTTAARTVVTDAVEEAERRYDPYIGTEHLLLGVTRSHTPVTTATLRNAGITTDAVRQAMVEQERGALAAVGVDVETNLLAVDGPKRPPRGWRRFRFAGHRPFTAGAKGALHASLEHARRLQQGRLLPEHLLLALTTASSTDPAVRLLQQLGVDVDDLHTTLIRQLQ